MSDERGPSRQRKGVDLIPLYAEIEAKQFNYLERLAKKLRQSKAKTLTQFLKIAEESNMFHVEQ